MVADATVLLTGIAHGGDAVGRHEGEVVFVPEGIPGEEVIVDLYRERRDLLRGEIQSVVLPSPERANPPCPYFHYCGGCQWQQISYDHQLELKRRIVAEQLQRLGRFGSPPVLQTLPSSRQWYYRNHVRFSAGRHGHLGFTRRASHRFLAVDHCVIAHPVINEMLTAVQGQGRGLHQVVMRVGEHTGCRLLFPPLPMPAGEPVRSDALEEELLGHRFHISLSSFFQVNTLQAERLAAIVLDRLALSGAEVVLDAYCGVGTFALLASPRAHQVIGIEEAKSATQNAARNAEGLDNVRFITGKTEEVLPNLGEKVDVVVLDPARQGCAPAVVDALAGLLPSRIVYVSCDPATLARDLRMLCDRGYRLVDVQPVDMFPQTYHIEAVATLVREAGDGA